MHDLLRVLCRVRNNDPQVRVGMTRNVLPAANIAVLEPTDIDGRPGIP